MKLPVFLAACFAFTNALLAADGRPADIRVTASPKSMGSDRPNKSTTVSHRVLKITVENRDQTAIKGLEVHWMMIARDIKSRALSIAAEGTDTVSIDRVDKKEIESSIASFTKKEGAVKRTGRGKNKRTTAQPDTGTRYAGYLVQVRHNGKIVAQAGTSGMADRFGD